MAIIIKVMRQAKLQKTRKVAYGSDVCAFYLDSRGQDRHSDRSPLRPALDALLRLATDRRSEFAIAVSRKGAIGSATEFERSVGREVAHGLREGNDVALEGIQMLLLTKNRQSRDFDRGPVLALYVDPTAFGDYFEEGRITDLIFVPWLPKHKEQFLSDFANARPLRP